VPSIARFAKRFVLGLACGCVLAAGSAVLRPLSSSAAELLTITWRPASPVHVTFHGLPESSVTPEVDLRPQIHSRGLRIRDQGNRGTCTVFATTFLIEYQKAGMPGQPKGLALSEEYLNWAGNKVAGTPYYDGGKFTKMVGGYQAWGIATSREMPYRKLYDASHPVAPSRTAVQNAKAMFPVRYPFVFLKNWDNTTGYTRAELRSVLATIRSGRPVATGIWWLNNFSTVTVHGVPLLKDYPRSANSNADPTKNPMFDGHSIDLVGFRESKAFPGGGYFIFRNSFGPSFGDDGYGFVSFQYLLTYGNDAIAVQPQPWVTKPVKPTTTI
jgi:hypothetical protein